MLWGASLVLVPICLQVVVTVLAPNRNPLQLLSTRRLLDDRLPKQVDNPTVWNELLDRLKRQKVSQAEAEEAIQELIAYMKRTRPGGWKQPLPWQDEFVEAAIQAKLIPEKTVFNFYDVYFNVQPVATQLPRIKEGPQTLPLRFDYGNPFPLRGLPITPVVNVAEVLVDGASVNVQNELTLRGWSGRCDVDLAPGNHVVVVKLDCAYVDSGGLLNRRARLASPISQQPGVRKRWITELTLPLTVVSAKQNNSP